MNKIKNVPQIFKIQLALLVLIFFFLFFSHTEKVSAATLSVTPFVGTFEVGSTFDVSLMLNTEGKNVNAIRASLSFPADILQVVSPSAGNSAITLWTSPPTYNNSTGTIIFEGGFQNGVNITNGLITKITFRVKSVGTAIIRFKDDSKVLLDDGKGTGALSQTNNGIYTLTLPPPAGPEVISETHPDQSRWYNNSSVILKWVDDEPELVEKYSYVLSDDPNEISDNVPEGDKSSVVYENLSDGRHYFHIKALNKDNNWGGTTHYALNIDNTPPAEFSIDIFPGGVTSRRNPIIQFATTDNLSSIDYYEMKIIPLSNINYVENSKENQQMFIEANSPYIAQDLELGNYDIIVRAYDKTGNYRDSIKRLKISNAIFQFVGDRGLIIKGQSVISWTWLILIFMVVILALIFIIYRLRHLHNKIEMAKKDKKLPNEIRKKMEELKRIKEKYKNIGTLVIFIASSLFFIPSVKAETFFQGIESPLITTISENISNNEIFYIGGKAKNNGQEISIYIKNERTGETFNENVSVDKNGEWFYRHDAFLSEGKYIMWAQSKIGDQVSPPSPQVEMNINKTALQFGSSRISYETLLSTVIIALFVVIIVLIFYAILFVRRIHKKEKVFKKEVREVEEALHKGFIILHREISKELNLLQKKSDKKNISSDEKNYRKHLMDDLEKIEQYIEKEIIDVKKLLG